MRNRHDQITNSIYEFLNTISEETEFYSKVSILNFVETHTVFSSFAADANATVNTTDDGIQQAKELFFATAHSYAAPDYRLG